MDYALALCEEKRILPGLAYLYEKNGKILNALNIYIEVYY